MSLVPLTEDAPRGESALLSPTTSFTFSLAREKQARTRTHAALDTKTATKVGKLLVVALGLIVTILALIIAGVVLVAYRASHTYYYYVGIAQPYLEELQARGMSMVRHADHSSESLDEMATRARDMAALSIPELLSAVNRTAAMVERLNRVSKSPVLKVTMEQQGT